MKSSIIVGMQWGDEGKGKIVDVLSEKADAVIRYQGGANAGHTVVIGDKKIILHLIPTGILQNKTSIIGNGVVVDIEEIVDELNHIKGMGFDDTKLIISSRAHMLLPLHKAIDNAKETRRKHRIGTTKRGIGPAYIDRLGRKGLRMGDMLDRARFISQLEDYIDSFNANEARFYKIDRIRKDCFIDEIMKIRKRILKYIANTEKISYELIRKKSTILFEGAQGVLLDIDFGTYPFVTSSHPIAPYAFCGSGFPILRDYQTIGIMKAYTTRVGEGPFPTRMSSEEELKMREMGGEYGATTGRGRDCGWLDLFAMKYSSFINSIDKIVLTKMDVLSGMKIIKVCTGYKLRGRLVDEFPSNADDLARVKPVYKNMKGWTAEDMRHLKNGKVSPSIRSYVKLIEKQTNAAVAMISTGPSRRDIVYLEKI